MKSMTGYGRATAASEGNQVTVEISAVNSRKQVDMRFVLPKELNMLEPELRRIVQRQLSRGSLTIMLTYQLSQETRNATASIDIAMAQHVARQLRDMATACGLSCNEPTIQDLLAVPGVIKEADDSPATVLKALAEKALNGALAELDAMRNREGAALQADLLARGKTVAELVEKIAAREDEALQQQKKRLQERIATMGVELTMDDERLCKEMAFYAEKADITEEVVRLRSHLVQYEALLHSEEDPGRNLDFLGQEMSREVNTLGAKTADLTISNLGLALKGEIARIREQVMNVE